MGSAAEHGWTPAPCRGFHPRRPPALLAVAAAPAPVTTPPPPAPDPPTPPPRPRAPPPPPPAPGPAGGGLTPRGQWVAQIPRGIAIKGPRIMIVRAATIRALGHDPHPTIARRFEPGNGVGTRPEPRRAGAPCSHVQGPIRGRLPPSTYLQVSGYHGPGNENAVLGDAPPIAAPIHRGKGSRCSSPRARRAVSGAAGAHA